MVISGFQTLSNGKISDHMKKYSLQIGINFASVEKYPSVLKVIFNVFEKEDSDT